MIARESEVRPTRPDEIFISELSAENSLLGIVELLERPAKTAALTGLVVDLRLTSDAAHALGTLVHGLSRCQSAGQDLSTRQVSDVLRAAFETVGLFELLKLWALTRFVRLARAWGPPPCPPTPHGDVGC